MMGLIREVGLADSWRSTLITYLPRVLRTEAEPVALADHSRNVGDRLPSRDTWRDIPLRAEAEVALRDLLADPASSRRESREAAVELAGLSAHLVPEALRLLQADGSPRAPAEMAKLGVWSANQLRNRMVTSQAEMLDVQRGIAATAAPLERRSC